MNKWSKIVDSCISCNTTEKRHTAKGLCVCCYLKQYHDDPAHKVKVKAQKHQHYLAKQKPKAQTVREIRWFDGKRQEALRLANFCCKACGIKGTSSSLVVHHIDGKGRGHKRSNNDLNNLTVLCRKCHAAEHREELIESRFHCGRDGWAKHYSCCIECGTTARKHDSHGRCVNCDARYKNSIKKI